MKNKIINLKINTLSPVSILDGNKLSPYIDIIKDSRNKEIIILDIEKVSEVFINNKYNYDTYLNILRNDPTNRVSTINMEGLLKKARVNLDKVTLKRIKYDYSIKNLTEVSTCIKTRGVPFIPGTTIKGAVRTAMLYSRMDAKDLTNVLENKRSKRTYVGEDIFRDNYKTIQSDILKNLIVRDTKIDEKINTSIYQVKSFNLYKCRKNNNFELDMPVLIESIDKNQVLNCQMIIKEKFDIEDIFDSINSFYEKVINREISELDKVSFVEKNILIDKYNLLINKVRNLKKSRSGFVMRIGKNKGFFNNTVLLDLDDEELFYAIEKEYKKNRGVGEFPTTKWVVCDDDVIKDMLGWIEVIVE